MRVDLSKDWQRMIGGELDQPYFRKLAEFVDEERRLYQVYPPELDVFTALTLTLYGSVHVLLLGQDPYHEEGQAHGLCFSVRPVVKLPPSLQNIFIELPHDPGCAIPNNGYLVPWAMQGILLLNAVLTVRAHAPDSHRGEGLGAFHRRHHPQGGREGRRGGFRTLGQLCPEEGRADRYRATRGRAGGASLAALGPQRVSRQPAVLSDQFGSRPFSATNVALRASGQPEIDWQIPDV